MYNIFRLKEKISFIFYGFILKPFFKKAGNKLYINSPLKIDGFNNIVLGNNVVVNYKTWLAASKHLDKNCLLEIGDGTVIGNFNHIYATSSIIIGKNVLTADKVYISDNLHVYKNINIPIRLQGVKQIAKVEIGDGTWIGENACIIGAKVGKNCVVAANAVVTKDIPDYSIVAGVPGKVIRRFNFNSQEWEKKN